MNKVLEVARTEKLIGSSLEAKVYLHTLDDSLAARLNEMTAAENDADTLHRIFITSQVISVPFHYMNYFCIFLVTSPNSLSGNTIMLVKYLFL